MIGAGYIGSRSRAPLSAGGGGPTVLLDANYLTDTLINPSDAAVSNGERVKSWTMATGGAWTSALAIAAGAGQAPIYVAASGVHASIDNGALTCAAPVTILADADCVIYAKVNLGALESGLNFIGSSTSGQNVSIGTSDGDGNHTANIAFDGIGTSYATAVMTGQTATGVYLLRFTRASGVWSFACTGVASAAMIPTGAVSGAISFDTLLAYGGGTLTSFSSTDMYLQKLKIWSGTSDPDTAYETANGGTL